MSDFIKTKLLFEYKPGQIIGLGFGNIVNSDADIVIASAFDIPAFTSNSSIGALTQFLKQNTGIEIDKMLAKDFGKAGYQIIDLSAYSLQFKKILLLCMGGREVSELNDQDLLSDLVINNLKKGLSKARILLEKETAQFTIDITAIGTRYGGIRKKECFDLLMNWATDLFNHCPNISLLRFISYDLDTFVDFFESTYRLQKINPENELTFSANYDSDKFTQFRSEIKTALKSLDDNPRSVIITCRTIIEIIVKSKIKNTSIKLADGILLLKDISPPNIYSYLTTCRLLGNFSNHDPNFIPTRRDAEGILLLTLRIVEWHLAMEH